MAEEQDDPRYVMGGGAQLTLTERWQRVKDAFKILPAPGLDRVAVVETPDPDYPVSLDDASKWQGLIDFLTMRQKAQAVYIRAGYGDVGIDEKGEANAAGANAAGMPHGLYWYVKAGQDFRQHVASFKAAWAEYGGELPPVMDCEYTGYTTNVKGNTANWLTKLIKNWQDETGVEPMIYTRQSWWDANTSRTDWPKTLDLWVAHYTGADEGTIIGGKPVPWIPADWAAVTNPRTWTMWQYSADGNGLGPSHGVQSASIDRNRWNGTINEFNQKYGTHILPLGAEPPVEPPPVTGDFVKAIYRVKVTASALNVRGGPGTGYTDLGDLKAGCILPVVSEHGDWLQIDGYIHRGYVEKVQ